MQQAKKPNTDVSAIYVAKYNRFVDTILGRINKILRERYDPVTVKLANPTTSTKTKTKTTPSSSGSTKKKTKKTTKRRKSNKRARNEDAQDEAMTTLMAQSVTEVVQELTTTEAAKISVTTLASTTEQSKASSNASDVTTAAAAAVVPTVATMTAASAGTTTSDLVTRLTTNEVSGATSHRGASAKRKKNKTRTTTKTGTKAKKPSVAATSSSNKVKAPAKQTTSASTTTANKRPRSKAKATLYGLASLKRSGDVSVNMMSDHTTIRTKFNLGPLILKVEKAFGRATRKEVRSATATTAEMSGRLSLRVYHGGAATLHSIRVLQPKQMRIESADDHDRTREFVWKRSSNIAHLVSQKLSSATRSMLRPAPINPAAKSAAAPAA